MDFLSKVLFVVFCFVQLSLTQSPITFTNVPTSLQIGQSYTITWSGGQTDQASFNTNSLQWMTKLTMKAKACNNHSKAGQPKQLAERRNYRLYASSSAFSKSYLVTNL